MNPILSIAVITYNQEKYIAQTLDSILNQKHTYSYEIIVGDDCSTDSTGNILKSYEDKYPGLIKVLRNKENKGIIGNYFNVIAHCSGEYIMECAGDDYWLPGKIEYQISLMKAKSIDMLYTRVFTEDDYGRRSKWGFNNTTTTSLFKSNKIPAVSVCFKSSTINSYIKEVNPVSKNWLMEDYPFWLWISKNGTIYFSKKITAVYRVFRETASHSINIEKIQRFESSVKDIGLYYAANNRKFIKIVNNRYYYCIIKKYLEIGKYEDYKKGRKNITDFKSRLKLLIYFIIKRVS